MSLVNKKNKTIDKWGWGHVGFLRGFYPSSTAESYTGYSTLGRETLHKKSSKSGMGL